MHLSPDELVYWQYGFFKLNATIIFTWLIMSFLVVTSMLVTKNLKISVPRTRWQNLLEIVVIMIQQQISDLGLKDGSKSTSLNFKHNKNLYLSFLGTLFLFIASANLFTLFPGYEPPTGSLSTTVALSICVFVAVPFYGVKQNGLKTYLKSYAQPVLLMLPFNLIGELSRTLALAVRLFGNLMSGSMIITILLAISPFLFPIIMTALGLLTGLVQAYIFFILAGVYIAAATSAATPKVAITNTEPLKTNTINK